MCPGGGKISAGSGKLSSAPCGTRMRTPRRCGSTALSPGTVYRNLGRFTETGQAASLGVIGGHERFDGDTSPHAHLICENCGAVVDVYDALPEAGELENISKRSGCRVESASVTFRGLCRDCLDKEEKFGTSEDNL